MRNPRTTIKLSIVLSIFFVFLPQAQAQDQFTQLRAKMVEEQIHARGVNDPMVLEAMQKVKRHLFVPPDQRVFSYQDRPLPIGYRQTISQPYIVAYMTEKAQLKEKDKVLEIGTGSGYQAAVLAAIVTEVYSIEIIEALAKRAEATLKEAGYDNIFIRHGDGYEGWQEHAPYDVIIVTAAPKEIPKKLVEQLALGGRMVVPVGSIYQNLYLITRNKKGIKTEELLPVRFVPMVKGEE